MTVSTTSTTRGAAVERPSGCGLADVVALILDKGLVIDAFVRVSLVGIELLTIDARIVVASVDTYLRFAEATNRLDLYAKGGRELPEFIESIAEVGPKGKTKGILDAIKETIEETLASHREETRETRRARPRTEREP